MTGGVVSTTGIARLTLGGGLGRLMSKYGLALDNLVSVEVVTADGRIVEANAGENTDLFWALRGGGGNFGVATSFKYRVHRVRPMITGGLIAHPFDKARDRSATLPDDHTLFAGFIRAPDGSGSKLVGMVTCHWPARGW